MSSYSELVLASLRLPFYECKHTLRKSPAKEDHIGGSFRRREPDRVSSVFIVKGGVKIMDKVIDIEERIPTLREKRRRRTNFKFITLLLLFFLTLFLLLYFQSPYSDIKKIDIQGSKLVDEEVYLQQSTLQIGNSMWGFHADEIEKKLNNNIG